MKNNYIYNILIFILILALLLLFINNLKLIEGMEEEEEGMGINTSELDYNKKESMKTISDNPGDADDALDSKMLDGVKDKPKLMSDKSEQGVRDKLDELQALLIGNIEDAFNSVNKVVPEQTLKARDVAYSILSYKDDNGDPLIASDLGHLRMSSDSRTPSLEYMENMNTEKKKKNQDLLNLDETSVIIFNTSDEKINIDRDQCDNNKFTTLGHVCPSTRGTDYNTIRSIEKMDTASAKLSTKLGSTNKSNITENESEVALEQRKKDAANYAQDQLKQVKS